MVFGKVKTWLTITHLLHGLLAVAQVAPEGKYIEFNGVNQYLVIPSHPGLNIAVDEDFTLSFRFKIFESKAQYSIVSKGNNLVSGGKYEFYAYPTNEASTLAFDLRNTDNSYLGAPSVSDIGPGSWYHVAWVYNSVDKTSSIYLNGELSTTTSHHSIGSRKIDNNADLLVGCGLADAVNPGKKHFWSGQFDELRIWKRALMHSEISQDVSLPKAAVYGLVAAYDFENLSTNMVPDVTGKGRNGQLYGFGIGVYNTELPVGVGESNERLTGFRIRTETTHEIVKSITIDLSGSDRLSDISIIKIYYNGSSMRLNLQTAQPFGFSIPERNRIVVSGYRRLNKGDNYFWVTADVSSTAVEGNQIQASVVSYTKSDNSQVTVGYLPGTRTILLANKLLFSSGDHGSKHYRIPAIATALDGSLVIANDKRWNDPSDLPADIDVVTRRSGDNGQTWSLPLTIAGEGKSTGYGDPSLVVNQMTGDIVCLFAGDNGFYASSSTKPIRIYQSISKDHGISWSRPVDITPQIYGSECSNPLTIGWQGAFVSSGSSTQLKSGRLMAVLVVRETRNANISNYIVYSDFNQY